MVQVNFNAILLPMYPATLNNIVDVKPGTLKNCYVCQGDLIVEKAFFSEKSVWLLPFDVSALQNNELYDHLPETILFCIWQNIPAGWIHNLSGKSFYLNN